MASSSLIPAATRELVPTASRKYLTALETVYGAALIAGAQVEAVNHVTDKASHGVTHTALIHEAMTKDAPLADSGLERLRNAQVSAAERIIDRLGGL